MTRASAKKQRPITQYNLNRLKDIKEELKALAEEAYRLVPPGITKDRAKGYWYAQLVMALDKDHDFLGSAMFTLESAIEELEEADDEE